MTFAWLSRYGQRRPAPPVHREGLCWMCGALADSREHRFKRTDYALIYGDGPYQKERGLFRLLEGEAELTPIQGPRSNAAKYRPSMCRTCNGAATQEADFAYDKLRNWTTENSSIILHKRCISFSAIYGSASWRVEVENLRRFYAKSLACRLYDDHEPIPFKLVELVRGDARSDDFTVAFAVEEERLINEFWPKLRMSPIRRYGPQGNHGYAWTEGAEWLTASVAWRGPVSPADGTLISAASEQINLGSHWHPVDGPLSVLVRLREAKGPG